MLRWLLVWASVAVTAVAADDAVIMVALVNGSSFSFTACQHHDQSLSLFSTPTLGGEAFSVAWQPREGTVSFVQSERNRVETCRLKSASVGSHDGGVTSLRLLILLSGVGGNAKVEVLLGQGSSGNQCQFDAALAGTVAASDQLAALTSFPGCVTAHDEEEVGGGGGGFGSGRHCFQSWSAGACGLASQPHPGVISRSKRAAPCSPTDCKNGGICNNISSSPVCICQLPYIAPYCSGYSDYCSQLQPDLNITSLPVCVNGTCAGVTLKPPYFNCTCSAGFEGARCEKDINDCAAGPCVNGLCRDLVNNYSCSCYSGWEGRNCSVNIDDCAATCTVRDHCIDGNSTCGCARGWQGISCNDVDFCARGFCPNGTTCYLLGAQNYECRGAATFAYGQASPLPTAWRLTPSGGLAEPLTTASGSLRTRQADANSTSSVAFMTVSQGNRTLAVALTPTGRLTVSLDNRTASVPTLSLAVGAYFSFNASFQPGSPISLTIVDILNGTSWSAQSADNLTNTSLTIDSTASINLGDGFKGCLDNLRLNSRLLPLSNWSLPAGVPGFVRLVDWPANQSAPAPPLIGCLGDPVCEQSPQPACLNSGRCLDLWNARSCACLSSYSGANCGVPNCGAVPCAAAVAGVSTPVVVTLSVLALVIVVVIIVVVLVKLARDRRSETGQYRPSKEEINHDRPSLPVREADTDLDDNIVLGNMQVARL